MSDAAKIRETLMTVLDADHADGVIEHRKKTIRKPFTPFAAKLLAKEFAKCPDPNAAAEEMILRGWQGFRAEWMKTREPRRSYQNNLASAQAEIEDMLFGGTYDRPTDHTHH